MQTSSWQRVSSTALIDTAVSDSPTVSLLEPPQEFMCVGANLDYHTIARRVLTENRGVTCVVNLSNLIDFNVSVFVYQLLVVVVAAAAVVAVVAVVVLYSVALSTDHTLSPHITCRWSFGVGSHKLSWVL
jgi:hypothetical protein